MKVTRKEDRSPVAVAMAWSSQMTTVAAEMVIPGLAGLWVDSKLGTRPLLGVIGFALGLVLGIWHLLKLVSLDEKKSSHEKTKHSSDESADTP